MVDFTLLFFSLRLLSEMSIDVSKTSAKATPFPPPLINLSLYPTTRQRRLANICVIFQMARFSTLSVSFFLSSSVTGKSFGDKERNVAHKGWEENEKWSGGVRLWKTSRWMKLSVTRAQLMHYAEDRIARFGVPLIDRPRIDYLKVYAGGLIYTVRNYMLSLE